MIIDTDKLQEQVTGLARIEVGYRTLLNSPDSTPELNAELQSGLNADSRRKQLAIVALEAIGAWEADGGMADTKEPASQSAIDALKRLAEDVALIPLDFVLEPQPTADSGTVNVV